jgi:16S rRNA (cytosine967-C5)-methyltransferase
VSRPPAAGPAGISARAIALDLLQAVLEQHRPLDEALDRHQAFRALEPRDRGFARLLAATVLRRLGQIDHVLGRCLEKPLPRRAAGVQQLLRLGIAQLLFLGTPAHAAVDTTVALIAGRGGEAGYKGLANAVLRRVDRERDALLADTNDPALNTPPWLWQSWRDSYGADTAATIATAHLQEAPLDLSVKADAAGWAERLGARQLPTGTLRLTAEGPVEALPGYADGAWWVQDAAAALPARLLGDVAGRRVIDLCAAPGGKTAQLVHAGANVTAVDRSPARVARLRENLARLSLQAETVVADAVEWAGPTEGFDGILIDAPCTSTGTIRRHPDVAWLRQDSEIAALTALQQRLLRKSVSLLKSGGMLVYCTCSLEPEEGEQAIATLLAAEPALSRVPIQASEVAGLNEIITAEGDLRTLPSHLPNADPKLGGLDGFFAARLVKS